MKKFAFALAVAVVSMPMLAQAAGKTATATMQVTFTVKDSCTVQAATGKQNAQPGVACQLGTPYQVQRAPAQPAAQATTGSADGNNSGANPQPPAAARDWVVYF